MSTIFKALDLQNPGETVVVKVRLPAFSSGVGAWSMFEREEAIGRQLDHPLILKFLPLAQDKRRSYVVTEHVPGPHPGRFGLANNDLCRNPRHWSIASQICTALDYIHEHGFVALRPESSQR